MAFRAHIMTAYKWQFAPRFRRHAFGWKSDTPIQRIKEALAEIKAVAKTEPVAAADGAVLFLEKLAPAIEQVDSSSGRIGAAVNHAIEVLAPMIAKADASRPVRQRWLDRLWQALQDDDMPYLESLGDHWGELCAGPDLAAHWADELTSTVRLVWTRNAAGEHGFFKGTTACMSALYAARRYDELLALLEIANVNWWHDRRWGAMALAARGDGAAAILYAEASKGRNAPVAAIAQFCERVLLDAGLADQAYAGYAVDAAYASTNLATFKAVARKYPGKPQETILRDLVARQPGAEGKWFAAAKDAGLFALAIELAERSPADPRTLIRAARDFALKQPEFAMAAGVAALRGIARGDGYDITSADVLDAYAAVAQAAAAAGVDGAELQRAVRAAIAAGGGAAFVARVLAHRLAA